MKIAQGEKKKQRHLKLLRTLCSCLARKRNDKDSALKIIQIMNVLVPDYLEREYSLCSVVCCVNECPAAGNCYFSPQSRSSITTLDGETNKKNNQSGNKKKHIGQGSSSAQNTTIINSQSLEDAQAG